MTQFLVSLQDASGCSFYFYFQIQVYVLWSQFSSLCSVCRLEVMTFCSAAKVACIFGMLKASVIFCL